MKQITITIFIFLINIFYAQGGFQARIKLPGYIDHVSKAIYETTPGNYIAAGFATDIEAGKYRYTLTLMGLNASGELQWLKKYGGNNWFRHIYNSFSARSFYKSGNYIYYTGLGVDSVNTQIGTFMKFNFNGDSLWQKIYTDPFEDLIPQMLTASVDNGFYLTGWFQDWVSGTRAGLLLKTDANGNELWRKRINKAAPNVQDGRGIIQDSASKKLVVVGYQYIGTQTSYTNYDNFLIMDSLGNIKYQTYFSSGVLGDIVQTKDKDVVAIGGFYLPSSNHYCYLRKLSINTPTLSQWSINTALGRQGSNGYSCLTERSNGEILIGGSEDSVSNENFQDIALRYTFLNLNGSIKSNRYYYYPDTYRALSNGGVMTVENTSDGGWVAAIKIQRYNTVNSFFFVKYDSLGCDNSSYVCATVGVNELEIKNEGIKIYPNPSSDKLFIEQNESPALLDISLKDLLGKEHRRIRIKNKAELYIRDLEKGIYFVELWQAGKLISTNKIIKE